MRKGATGQQVRFRAKMQKLERFQDLLRASQGHNLASTVLYVPGSLAIRTTPPPGCDGAQGRHGTAGPPSSFSSLELSDTQSLRLKHEPASEPLHLSVK